MSADSQLSSPPPSLDECALIGQLRTKLAEEVPGGIPVDLNTDLNLLRWIRGFNANFGKITKNFGTYVASRRAAGFDMRNLPEKYFDLPHIKPFLPYIASTRLDDRVWLEERNAFLFVERAWSQPKEFVKAVRCSDYLVHCFGYSELLLQLILRREKEQDAGKGPVQFIVFFDLATVNLTDYVNPLSAQMKLWQVRSNLWQDWYPEMVQKIYLVNPPRIISVLWKLARLFLTKENLKLIEIIGNHEDLQNDLPAWFIPREYAGEFVNNIPPGDETGVSVRRKIVPEDYINPYEMYRSKGVIRPKSRRKDVAAGTVFVESVVLPDSHTKLLWDFTCSNDIEFTIYDKMSKLLYPQLHLFTTKLPEEGLLENLLPAAEYFFEFRNPSGYFTSRVDYSICSAP